jgi:hypothetical protein
MLDFEQEKDSPLQHAKRLCADDDKRGIFPTQLLVDE